MRVCLNEENLNGIQSVSQWNVDIFSLTFSPYSIDLGVLSKKEMGSVTYF